MKNEKNKQNYNEKQIKYNKILTVLDSERNTLTIQLHATGKLPSPAGITSKWSFTRFRISKGILPRGIGLGVPYVSPNTGGAGGVFC
jgi:hypothetical protein